MLAALEATLFWAVVLIVLVVLAAIPLGAALWLGPAWAIIVSAGLAWLIGWQCGKAGMVAGIVALPSWAAVAVGLLLGLFWLAGDFIMRVAS